jgi:hypothetical protein
MKRLFIVIFSLACLASVASAETRLRASDAGSSDSRQLYAIAPEGPGAPNGLRGNASACSPEAPEAVWGAHSELLGYRCVMPGANGS